MPPIWVLLNHISEQLNPVSDSPRFEAELLLAHALNISRAELLSRIKEDIDLPDIIEDWIQRRKKYEPLAYILGYTEFFGLKIKTIPPIFIPRPETEILVEETLKIIETLNQQNINVLELCTGTGCIPIALLKNTNKKIYCLSTDINEEAITLARENARINGVNINFLVGDLFECLSHNISFDIILSNPPYISESDKDKLPPTIRDYEDSLALFCEKEGTQIIQKIVEDAKYCLKDGGHLLLEIGDNQKEIVEKIFHKNGYDNIDTTNDLQKIPRVIKGRWHKRTG